MLETSYLPYEWYSSLSSEQQKEIIQKLYKELTVDEGIKKELEEEIKRHDLQNFLEQECQIIIKAKKRKARRKKRPTSTE